jgi:hypothetical protein
MYDGKRLYGMQFRAGDSPGRCHFPWGRCGVFNGDGQSNGEVYLSCVQGVAGKLTEPMRWKVKDNIITEVDGGGEVGEECKRLFKEVPESNRLSKSVRLTQKPRRSSIDDPMHWEQSARCPGPASEPAQAPELQAHGRFGS